MNLTIPQGWQCPMCNRVYSPTTPMCFSCPQTIKTGTNTSGFEYGAKEYDEQWAKLFLKQQSSRGEE